jgi:hypothetical protein
MLFDFERPNLEPASIDHALQTIDHEIVAILVTPDQMASAQKSLSIDLDESLGVGLGVFPIAKHHLITAHNQLTDLADREFNQCLRIEARLAIAGASSPSIFLPARNYPSTWTRHYLQSHYGRFDPVIMRSLGHPEPFEWGLGLEL